MMQEPSGQTVFFQPAPGKYGAAELNDDTSPSVGKMSFTKGVAMTHAFLLFSIFIPPVMLCTQMASNGDLKFWVGAGLAQLGQLMALPIILIPMMHFSVKFTPWGFLLSVWIPAFTYVGIGWHYWNETHSSVNTLQSQDCLPWKQPGKADLQTSYDQAQHLYLSCADLVTTSIEECPQYWNLWDMSQTDFNYLKSLEHRFQCAGVCTSAMRLWETPGTSAPACSLFIAEWIKGAMTSATFVLWYSVVVILSSIPIFIVLLDTFFVDYYQPLSIGKGF